MRHLDIDAELLLTLVRKMAGRVGYGWGRKAKPLSIPSARIKKLDCSGFVKYMIYRVTGNQVIWPDGSKFQYKRCKLDGFPAVNYRGVMNRRDHVLRIAFKLTWPNHTWLTLDGATIECASRLGVCRLPAEKRAKIAHACFELGKVEVDS